MRDPGHPAKAKDRKGSAKNLTNTADLASLAVVEWLTWEWLTWPRRDADLLRCLAAAQSLARLCAWTLGSTKRREISGRSYGALVLVAFQNTCG